MTPVVLPPLSLPHIKMRCAVASSQLSSLCLGGVITVAAGCLSHRAELPVLSDYRDEVRWEGLACDSKPETMVLGMRLAKLQVEAEPVSSYSRASAGGTVSVIANLKDQHAVGEGNSGYRRSSE